MCSYATVHFCTQTLISVCVVVCLRRYEIMKFEEMVWEMLRTKDSYAMDEAYLAIFLD